MKSKLLQKDYSEELEEICESKRFEKEAQNLLLSMLYKVDGAYNDYKTVKREVPSKEEFLQIIIDIVRNYCREIEIARPNSELEKELAKSRCKIVEEEPDNKYNKEQKVIFFPNEKVVLYSIIKAGMDKINANLNLKDKAILASVQIGRCISASEVIRDFNGFSWSQIISEIESIECNAVYTDLIYLLGEKYVNNLNSNNIEKMHNIIDSELLDKMQKIATKFYLEYDEKQLKVVNENLTKDKQKLDEMSKGNEYVEKITKIKKELLNKIGKIDEQLNDPKELRDAYINYNKELPNEKKVFSVSHYEEMIQNKRESILEEIEEYNKLQNPIEFVKIKQEIEGRIKYFEEIKNITISDLQKCFFENFCKMLDDLNEKEKLIDYIYKIRYLKYLPISKNQLMKDIIDFEKLEKKAIKKCIEKNIITPISNNPDTDYLLLKSIFETKNILLEGLSIKLSVKNGKLISEIYDGDILDSTNEVNLPDGSNIHLRKTKKVKIFD